MQGEVVPGVGITVKLGTLAQLMVAAPVLSATVMATLSPAWISSPGLKVIVKFPAAWVALEGKMGGAVLPAAFAVATIDPDPGVFGAKIVALTAPVEGVKAKLLEPATPT
jgi:hypothetical protein